jgi:pilus assembly protein CpaB
MVDIVVTTQTIGRGTIITEAALTTIRYPKKEVVEGTFYGNPMDVAGKRAKIDLAPRVPVTTSVVLETVEGSFAAFQVPSGMVAVSIPITRLSSVSFAPRPGDHVNIISTMMFLELDTEYQARLPNQTGGVIAPGPDIAIGVGEGESSAVSLGTVMQTLSAQALSGGQFSVEGRSELDTVLGQQFYLLPSEEQRPRIVSQTLLQDAIVLQLGNFALAEEELAEQAVQPTPAPEANNQEAPAAPEPIKQPDLITVVVTPQDAVTLNYLLYSGAQLTFALRGAGDEQRVQTEAVTLQYLMDQYNIPVPAKLPYGMEPRLDVLTPPVLKNDVPVVTPK